jgi:hypothetical protein
VGYLMYLDSGLVCSDRFRCRSWTCLLLSQKPGAYFWIFIFRKLGICRKQNNNSSLWPLSDADAVC